MSPIYDSERFGIHFVASPRHADLLLVTGPVTRNMEVPLRKTYEATPSPKLVVAVGDCARTCGVFKGSYAVAGSVAANEATLRTGSFGSYPAITSSRRAASLTVRAIGPSVSVVGLAGIMP